MVKIKCPYCGREYFPSEIYYPNEFFGNPGEIIRDLDTGSILDYTGTDMNLSEEYICDNCGKSFKVTATISFETSIDNDSDFSEDYSMPLFDTKRLTLEEPK